MSGAFFRNDPLGTFRTGDWGRRRSRRPLVGITRRPRPVVHSSAAGHYIPFIIIIPRTRVYSVVTLITTTTRTDSRKRKKKNMSSNFFMQTICCFPSDYFRDGGVFSLLLGIFHRDPLQSDLLRMAETPTLTSSFS